jgi:hypothetical protein
MMAWLLTLLGCGKQHASTSDLPAPERGADRKLFYPVLRNYFADRISLNTYEDPNQDKQDL